MVASSGVVFPLSSDDGTSRSTSALGRAVVADALRAADPIGARAAEQETHWRGDYVRHFHRLIEAGLSSGTAARRSAADGLTSLHDRMRVITPDRGEIGLRSLFADKPDAAFETATVVGGGAPEAELTLPYQGNRLGGDDLRRRLDAWVAAGVIEPSCADAVRLVMANPDWLRLADRRVVVLGAGAEMGPLRSLLRWGAEVVAVDLPRRGIWSGLLDTARSSAGTLHVPMPLGAGEISAELAGADLLHQLPELAGWLGGLDGPLVLGNYVYADGATNVRVSVAVDALTAHLTAERDDIALAFLATPTDAFAVPADAVAHSERAYGSSSLLRTLRQPIRLLSAGKLLRRNYAPGADPGICDSLVPQQGPNYALAKRLQRWRAAVAREAGTTVSFKVAPPTRTRSVIKNRALAAAYAGAHVFDVEVFEPATSNTLMAALLVHDLHNPLPLREHVWEEEAFGAAHGGLWRTAYSPRSALGLAALIGLGGARG
ncbi:hypothetical protein F4553_002049 [Allocatelliglobosispora scoriae]|uniref:Uncharacterized protein n=1 Tax=Allocatelliglobosispora scoriae TaxID=643052 RepID=A0A841BPC9_9ACTN|nr:hypothetical protein [Allocatelliglobosispora scoriae]MBB5868670.1 hypothetical protein [Allocatelliglobosispora scoriae]